MRERVTAMQRARRLASVVVAVTVGVLALAGCRSEPGVAAYVGDRSFSHQDVDRVVDEISEQIRPEERGVLRRNVVQMLVVREVATRYAAEHDITVPTVDPVSFALSNRLPPNTHYAELAATFNAAVEAVDRTAPSVEPTEADQREVYSHLTVQGVPISDSFESARPHLGQQQIGKAVGLRNLLRDALDEADVTVNPQYGNPSFRIPVQVQPASSWLTVPLTDREPAVSDVTGQL
ncbi:hypothetical protein GCM10027290_09120 [Micromonospora sonneratiae]|uniref:SurA N-terminal domain-containing protein n=1 Tax=Micromonospora sonneratiae TaxID=1184706 RepID=A0ABW3YEU7_9ACTN